MKQKIVSIIIFVFLSGNALRSADSLHTRILTKLTDCHAGIVHIHPFLNKFYPVAIADSGLFYIYDYDSLQNIYRLIKKTNVPFDMPENFAASFPLVEYDARPSCIIGTEILKRDDNAVTIFHEFMHCAQMENKEQSLKSGLNIYKKAAAVSDYMWEITHDFPYSDSLFTAYYSTFLVGLQNNDPKIILSARNKLKKYLNIIDYEYMCWQEWKEGFARHIENRLREILSLPQNNAGKDIPFNRISFYYGGDRYMRFLQKQTPGILNSPTDLFTAIFNFEQPD